MELCAYEGPHTPVYGLLALLLISPFMSVPLQLLMSLLHKKGGGVALEHLTSSSVSYCWLIEAWSFGPNDRVITCTLLSFVTRNIYLGFLTS